MPRARPALARSTGSFVYHYSVRQPGSNRSQHRHQIRRHSVTRRGLGPRFGVPGAIGAFIVARTSCSAEFGWTSRAAASAPRASTTPSGCNSSSDITSGSLPLSPLTPLPVRQQQQRSARFAAQPVPRKRLDPYHRCGRRRLASSSSKLGVTSQKKRTGRVPCQARAREAELFRAGKIHGSNTSRTTWAHCLIGVPTAGEGPGPGGEQHDARVFALLRRPSRRPRSLATLAGRYLHSLSSSTPRAWEWLRLSAVCAC